MKSQKSYEKNALGHLYLVATPIGNLKDISLRALEIMQEVDYIAAEDTRHTLKLLNHYDIKTPLLSYHEHNKMKRTVELTDLMQEGKNIALVSDAGTPVISDPGADLVQACLAASLSVISIPGANAGISALITSGLPAQPFYFYGFLSSQKKKRKEELEYLARIRATLILYESPHRLQAMLKDAVAILGSDRKIALARELTKQYEEILRGKLEEALLWSQGNDIRGEFCLIIEGASSNLVSPARDRIYISYADHVKLLMEAEQMTSKEAIKEVAVLHNVSKRLVYNEFHDLS